MDLVFAGSRGIRIFQQKDISHFVDVTAATKIPATVINGSYTGAWEFDVDLDGDLDIVLGPDNGNPIVLRNNGDGTFAVIKPFSGVDGLKAFASADVNGDSAPDAAMISRDGRLHVFDNQRLGQYRPRAVPNGRFEAVLATAMDFYLLRDDGSVLRLSDSAEIAKVAPVPSPALIAADFDNNGSMDLLAGGGEIFMGGAKGFTRLPFKADLTSPAAVDLDGDGRLDLIGISSAGAQALMNRGAKNYHWQNIRPRAANARGDQRINSFGIGGEIEVRAGLLDAEAGDRLAGSALRHRRPYTGRCRPDHVAERRGAGGIWFAGESRDSVRSASERVVPVAFRVGWQADEFRQGWFAVVAGARVAYQCADSRGHLPD